MSTPDPSGNSSESQGRFATTRWSMVLAAGDQDSPQGHEALAALCTAYWYPLYAFVRRQGFAAHQAQDLTQEFFARMLEKHFLAVVNPEKGKFRSFLLASCKHFLSNERDREQAQKRGGHCTILPLDFAAAESRYSLEPADNLTPEHLFERRWALTLLDQALARLRAEFVASDKSVIFEAVKGTLTGAKTVPYEQLAAELDMSISALKVAVHRLRGRYRELLREEIGRTLGDGDNIDDEIRNLFSALS